MGGVNEHTVTDCNLEIVFAFDEIIGPLGYAESDISSDQVATYLEMFSQEENLHDLIQQSREEDAIQQGKIKAAAFAKKRAEGAVISDGIGSSYKGVGSRSRSGFTFAGANEQYDYSSGRSPSSNIGSIRGSSALSDRYSGIGSGSGSDSGGSRESYLDKKSDEGVSLTQPTRKPKSISLRSKAGPKRATGVGKDLLNDLIKEGDVHLANATLMSKSDPDVAADSGASGIVNDSVGRTSVKMEKVHVRIEETVNAELNREGGVSKLDVKGEMFLTISDSDSAAVRILLSSSFDNAGFQWKTHPNIDKRTFTSSNVIALKNPKRPFPVNTSLKILTWRLKSISEERLPLSVSCWPSTTPRGMSVTVEYELRRDMDLSGVVISIPVPDIGAVSVEPLETGTFKLKSSESTLQWLLSDLSHSENPSGSIEFTISGCRDENQLFPIEVGFTSPHPISQLSVDAVESTVEEGKTVEFSEESHVTSVKYSVM